MEHLHERAPQGERCVAAAPHGHWKTTTSTGGLTLRGLVTSIVIDGAMAGPTLRVYVEKTLVLELRLGAIVVIENLPARRARGHRRRCAFCKDRRFMRPPADSCRSVLLSIGVDNPSSHLSAGLHRSPSTSVS